MTPFALLHVVLLLLQARSQPDSSPFRRLELPPPNSYRDSAGRPGPRYWQQRVRYSIDAVLDTSTQSIVGREVVRYVNNSPDTLHYLWFQLDQNIYRADSRGASLFPDLARGGGADFHGGYVIDSLVDVTGASDPGRGTAESGTVEGTLMRMTLAHALVHGDSAMLRIAYHFQIPERGSNRMGRTRYVHGWTYGIAQWYPRLAVYDDVNGWNLDEYIGQGEFYLEYGDIDFAITVPRGFIVAGSGTLLNPAAVLTAVERSRLTRARTSETPIAIVSRLEAGRPMTRPVGSSSALTWRFSARNVRDVAWAASPAFVWVACGWQNILMQSFYEPDADPDWSNAATYIRNTIKVYSRKWLPYPYPTATAVAGPNTTSGGMEYPMIVFDPSGYGGGALRAVTLHEMGHQWFPMIVGSNERRYAWMDEGIDTFINDADDWSDRGGFSATGNGDGWVRAITAGRDGIPMTMADSLPASIEEFVSYRKPSMGLYLMRHQIVADTTRFDAALREYIRRWAFKHPTPADFFRTMETQLRMDMSWFWRGWFYSTGHVDLAIDSVTFTGSGGAPRVAHLYLATAAPLPMPVPLRLTFADGRTRNLRLPVDIWRSGRNYRFDVSISGRLRRAEIDADHNLPDVDRRNNVWVSAS